MANKIQLRRGVKSKLPTTLMVGEPAYTTDTNELFVGTGSGNVNMGGSQWYTGTSLTGTSSGTSYSSCPTVKVGDKYLNTSTGYFYECTTAGSGSSAKWAYKGSLKGANGTNGTNGTNGKDGTSAAWFTGTSMSGTGTKSVNVSGAKARDMYLNTSTGDVYEASSASSWTWKCNIKGPAGKDGTTPTVDTALSENSSNIVQNKAIATALPWRIVNSGGWSGVTKFSASENGAYLLKKGSNTVNYSDVRTNSNILLQGEGQGITNITFAFPGTVSSDSYAGTVTFRDMTITFTNKAYQTNMSAVFINCKIIVSGTNVGGERIWSTQNDVTMINCNVTLSPTVTSSGNIVCEIGIIAGNVSVNNCRIDVNTVNVSKTIDVTFIYNGAYTQISNCNVTLGGGSYGRACLVYLGVHNMSNNKIVAKDARASVYHNGTDGNKGGMLTGNYIEFYQTYLRASTVSGNIFNNKGDTITLLCSTIMNGNVFKGSSVNINCSNKTHIIKNNIGPRQGTVSFNSLGSNTQYDTQIIHSSDD